MNQFALQTQGQVMVDPSLVVAAETSKALVQAAYIMAMQRPRNYDQARAKILNACRRPEFAERQSYSKPVGKKKNPQTGQWEQNYIIGPSIRFAELCIREYGNIRSDVQSVYEDQWIRRIKVTLLDLETNSTFGKETSIAKTVERKEPKDREVLMKRVNSNGETIYVVAATEDELANKEAAAISKIIRNEGLRLIPSDIIDEARLVSEQTLSQRDAKDPEQGKKRMIDAFSTLGIYPADIEKYLHHSIAQISPNELAELRGAYQAIKDGEARWSDYTEEVKEESKEKESAKEAVKERFKKPAESGPSLVQLQNAIRDADLTPGDILTWLIGIGVIQKEQQLKDIPADWKEKILTDPTAIKSEFSAYLDNAAQ